MLASTSHVSAAQSHSEMIQVPASVQHDALFLENLGRALAASPGKDPFPLTHLGRPTVSRRMPEQIPGLTVDEVWLTEPSPLLPFAV